MKFFLDTAQISEIRWAAGTGLIDGITTNPTLMAKAAGDVEPEDIFREICSLVDGPVSAEVIAVDADEMVDEGRRLAALHDNVVVKVPMTEDGMVATQRLVSEDIKVNVTLCFSSMQCLLAAKAGATYVSPFVGRIDDGGQDGMDVIRESRMIFDNYGMETQILAASIRHPRHVAESALVGADVATLPTKILKQLFKHPLTDKGLDQFLKDWESLQAERKRAAGASA